MTQGYISDQEIVGPTLYLFGEYNLRNIKMMVLDRKFEKIFILKKLQVLFLQ